MSISITDAVLAIKSDAKVVVRGDDIDGIEWIDGETPISKSDILAKQTELQTEYDAQEYARNRQAEYPSIDELVVALWENVVEERASAVVALEAKRQAVKVKHPKP
tara:strand:+ start:1582 stop:1899 length:318 start_codon:yes stop_codon:yes gene_type:complete